MENEKLLPKTLDKESSEILDLAEQIIYQTQYSSLETLTPAALPETAMSVRPSDVVCMFRVSELVFSREKGSGKSFATVLNALHACGATCFMIIQCREGKSELYLGAVNKQKHDNPYFLSTIRDILRSGIEGNLPGTEITEVVSRSDIESKLNRCIDNGFDSQCITAVSCVASDEDDGSEGNGIESLLDAVSGKNFTIMVLADPVSQRQVQSIRSGYEQLGTQLSSLEQTSVSYQSGINTSHTESTSKSFSKSIGKSLSSTQSHTQSSGWSKPEVGLGGIAKMGIAACLGEGLNIAHSTILNTILPQQSSTGSEGDTKSKSKSESVNNTESDQFSYGDTTGRSSGVTVQSTVTDRSIKSLTERIDWYLKWLNSRENLGMFDCCAYIISSNAGTNLMAASQYQALMQGKREMGQPVTINTWTKGKGIENVKEYLSRFSHPVMECPGLSGGLTPAMLVSSKELARQMALPQRSVVGVSVMEYASFGRDVVRKDPLRSGKVMRVGTICHMGREIPNQPVLLDMQSMRSHTFIAGTNGSGKSNTVFKLLEEFLSAGIPFLVIEPAKGEYKNVFGREPNVRVYGTNSKKTELLRLNPFWFNDDVSVLEHIDNLMAVFNASWSMYAAMPSVLKSAIENAYKSCGWNLTKSVCRCDPPIFPTVKDVMEEFNSKMESTAFSEEVKGNYVGALSTRMESLCNGIYGEIFGGMNLSDEELFNSNVIIDLSRVGSAETKSMLMGILVIRLQEYRAASEAMNSPLKHITVLEEAHHLLRRTSLSQSDEGSNMLGKSVEMISNAIAEMRSYGEGFIIVDQSPGLLDTSVIRNTNTKLILRLPEGSDRDIVGRAMGLTPEQTNEISRLKTGVCAIYQQNWLETVLCKVDRACHEEEIYESPADAEDDEKRRLRIAKALLSPYVNSAASCGNIKDEILSCGISGKEKIALIKEFTAAVPNKKNRRSLVCSLTEWDLEPPADVSAAKDWYNDILSDKEQKERWGEYLTEAFSARLAYLSGTSAEWKQAAAVIAGSVCSSEELRKYRGIALKKICLGDSAVTDDDELKKACKALGESFGADEQLAELLKSTDRIRDIVPCCTAVYELMGGSKVWDCFFPLIKTRNIPEWDKAVRGKLAETADCGRDTETAVLKLFLQNKGKLPEVKTFYNTWLVYIRENV